jgi:prolyl 4-hydroxylase
VGHRQLVPGLAVQGKEVWLETLSLVPLVFSISGFLAEDECDFIIKNGRDRVQASPVALMDKDKGKPATEWRTSSQAWLDPYLLPVGIKERTASLLRVNIRNQEQSVQFLRYGKGQKYDAHHDYFDMEFYKQQPEVVRQYDNGYKNRLSTVFWYLNDVAKGGETQFPRAGGKHQPHNFARCQGLKVKPVKGKVILFYSLRPSGEYDYFSLHGGCPVLGNDTVVKWAANQWTWNKPF